MVSLLTRHLLHITPPYIPVPGILACTTAFPALRSDKKAMNYALSQNTTSGYALTVAPPTMQLRRETTRVYVAEGWKQQRLEWLEAFEPGVIRSPLLRDALGLQEEDPGNTVEWLRNIAYWGYPPGWVSCRDPRQLVYSRILGGEEHQQVVTTECDSFVIFEGADDDDEVDLTMFNPRGPSVAVASSLTISAEVGQTRWATYPNTYFFSTALSIYNGAPLDRSTSVSPSRVSVTFTPERRALWDRILSGGLDTSHIRSVPPWRLSGVFGAMTHVILENDSDFAPPPPTTPPPLPCPPKLPVHNSNTQSTHSPRPDDNLDITDDKSMVDMDMSDDE
ncbi:hypothetical protein JVU11DRAFT_852 [Chiua virens]|nr:hypothetical protein JVU11DRAFT_852 [Chiua virens]